VLRARIVLLAAEGKQDLKIAHLLAIVPRIAARWRSRFLRDGIAGLERDAPRPGRTPSNGDCQDDTGETFSCDPREHSHDGRRGRYQRGQCTAHLARSRSEAAPRGNLQAEQRSPFCRETGGHRRPVSEFARACARAVIGREEPDPSS
jgi:hypothetical protein